MRTVHIAIVGCGSIAQQHMQCLRTLGGVEVRAFCDLDEGRAGELQRTWGNGQITSDVGSVMRDDETEAVYVCTTTDSHAPLALAALQAGKHVFMEKPLALSERECYEVANAAEKFNGVFMMGFKFRFYLTVARARAHIREPLLSIGQVIDTRWPDCSGELTQ